MVEIPFPAYAALVSSFLWAAASVYTFRTVKEVGPVVFNTYRVAIGFVVLWAAALAFGPRAAFNWSGALLLMLSGAIGVFLGDILRYAATVRLGPRRTVVLMATNSPMVIGFGAAFLGEVFSLRTYLGIALILVAVLNMALFDIRSDQDRNRYEVITGIAWTGVIVGLAAAVFQASGILLAKLALTSAFDPLQATALRISGAFAAAVFFTLATGRTRALRNITAKQISDVAVSTVVAMGCGTVLLLYALKHAPAGIVAVLQSMVPVFITLIVWAVMKRMPHRAAVASVVVTVFGLALISWA